MRALMRDLAPGAFTYALPALALLERAIDIDRQYADLGLGLVDASVVALAEELGVYRLATRNPDPVRWPTACARRWASDG